MSSRTMSKVTSLLGSLLEVKFFSYRFPKFIGIVDGVAIHFPVRINPCDMGT